MPRRTLLTSVTVLLAVAAALLVFRRAGRSPAPVHNAFGRGPTVVLVHGLGSKPQQWLPTARQLARRFRVVLVELPGHGISAMPEPFSLEDVTRALDRAIAAETDAPVILVGHSIGGLIATAEAIENPDRVRGLVLVETLLRPQGDDVSRRQALDALDHDYEGFLRGAYLAFGRDSVQGMAMYREVAAQEPAHIKRWIRLALTTDLSVSAAALRMPVLAVVAPHTWPVNESWPMTAAAIGYENIRDLQPARVEGSGHFVPIDCPAELARIIESFALRRGDGPAAMATPRRAVRFATGG